MRIDNLAGQRVLITGASRGIGRATALMMGELGAKVGVNFIRQKTQAELVKREIERAQGEAVLLLGDVSKQAEAEKMVEQMVGKWDGIDVLVNNAGTISWKPLLQEDLNKLRQIVEVNLIGMVTMTYLAAKIMKQQEYGGVIVNIASGAGKTAYPNLAVYSATKFGVLGFTKAVAQELYQDRVRVYAVSPGTTATDMTDRQGMKPEKVAKKIIQTVQEELDLMVGEDVEAYR